MTKERMMSLTDGVFAIAITLLVLELRLPEIPFNEIDRLFLPSLCSIFPKILGVVLSFFIIASYWLSFHRIYSFIRDIDRQIVLRTIFFLFFIALMPFPTYLLGLYGDHASVVIFYALFIAISSIFLALLWQHIRDRPVLLNQQLDPEFTEYMTFRTLIPPLVFLVSILIALVNPLIAMLSWGSLLFTQPLLRWKYTGTPRMPGRRFL